MIDWNGNGKIDPVDIGISIAMQEQEENEEEIIEVDEIETGHKVKTKGTPFWNWLRNRTRKK